MKKIKLFSESVELGVGEVFGLGDLCRRRASVSRSATCESNDDHNPLLFLLDESFATPKEGPHFVPFRFSRRCQC